MDVVYATLIINGMKTFEQVPKSLQSKVELALKTLGYDKNGNPL